MSRPHSFNVGLNLGRSAGGSLSEHLHQHVVPRWTGDANFITVVGGTKTLGVTHGLVAIGHGERDMPMRHLARGNRSEPANCILEPYRGGYLRLPGSDTRVDGPFQMVAIPGPADHPAEPIGRIAMFRLAPLLALSLLLGGCGDSDDDDDDRQGGTSQQQNDDDDDDYDDDMPEMNSRFSSTSRNSSASGSGSFVSAMFGHSVASIRILDLLLQGFTGLVVGWMSVVASGQRWAAW